LRVLVAEDNAVNQEVAAAMLRRRGHFVEVANNGRDAVSAARAHEYDVILMDLHMPELDGLSATREIRQESRAREATIVALTASAIAGERERCLTSGMDDYLAKPFKPSQLFAVVEGTGEEGEEGEAGKEGEDGDTPSIDVAQFIEDMETAGVEDSLPSILAMFHTEAPQRLALLDAAVAARDPERAGRAAHSLKSMASTIYARRLGYVLLRIENAGLEQDLPTIDALLPDARRAFDAAMVELRRAASHR